MVARSATRSAAVVADRGDIEVVLSQPNEVVRAIGINASHRRWINVMTFLRQLD